MSQLVIWDFHLKFVHYNIDIYIYICTVYIVHIKFANLNIL